LITKHDVTLVVAGIAVALTGVGLVSHFSSSAAAAPVSSRQLPAGYTTACIDHNGTVTLAVGAAVAGDKGLTDCKVSIEPMTPAADGDYVVLTAPSGHREYFKLGPRTKP
jgi:hypothetical protein